MKRFMISAICGAMVLSLVACEKGNINIEGKNTNKITSEDSVEIPSPFQECKTIEEAEKLIGFKVNIPTKLPEGYVQDSISVIDNEFIQVIYSNGENEICFRQAKGEEDISGDYNEYNETNTINVSGIDITTKGNNSKVNLARWTKEGYTFAISINILGQGLESSDIIDMIDSNR
jgi:hypothetical protein